MKSQPGAKTKLKKKDAISRRRFLTATAGMAGAVMARQAAENTLADEPPRGPGDDMSAQGERSQCVHIYSLPEHTDTPADVIAAELTNCLIPGAVLVPSVVAFLVELQRAGFTYSEGD